MASGIWQLFGRGGCVIRGAALITFGLLCFACGDRDGDNYTQTQGDCDDEDPLINPFAEEICDGVDQDCDGQVDEGLVTDVFPDADNDGFGDDSSPVETCGVPAGYSSQAGDCDDSDPDINPAAEEICNGLDENCNQWKDEGATRRFYKDADGDGYGTSETIVDVCEAPPGFVSNSDDCDDSSSDVHPFAVDNPDELDNDCDGIPDNLYLQVAGGYGHSMALRSDGTVWSWGLNSDGQLGTGATVDQVVPSQATGLDRVVAIAAGYKHSMALRLEDGADYTELWVWGDNAYGQLGDGTGEDSLLPIRIDLLELSRIGAGAYHSLALQSGQVGSEGDVWAWGAAEFGQVGDGSDSDQLSPVALTSLQDISRISAGDYHSFSIDADGNVSAWGLNDLGQLGDGTTTNRHSPISLFALSDIIEIGGGEALSVALFDEGTVYTWGLTFYDEDTEEVELSTIPELVEGLSDISAVVAGGWHAVVLSTSGVVQTWGRNLDGQLGDGTTVGRWTPGDVGGLPVVRAVAVGYAHTLALGVDGAIWAWGANDTAQLGDWTNEMRTTPVQVRWTLE